MPHICALFTHYNSLDNTKICLQRLAAQSRQPDSIVIVNNKADGKGLEEQLESLPYLHILIAQKNLGNAGGCAMGMDYAFGPINADFVWVLDDDSWPRPSSLAALLAQSVGEDGIRMSLVLDPTRGDELSWPLSSKEAGEKQWRHIRHLTELPDEEKIISRGGWLGALYPQAAWKRVGSPTATLFIRGEDEEYPWRLRQAGYHFITVRHSILDHPSPKGRLYEFSFGAHSFFYETGLALPRQYYKNRNWAWLQRQKYPKRPLLCLLFCLAYASLSVYAMSRYKELELPRLHQLIRALSKGYRQKLVDY